MKCQAHRSYFSNPFMTLPVIKLTLLDGESLEGNLF